MKYCQYCGKALKEGEICDCTKTERPEREHHSGGRYAGAHRKKKSPADTIKKVLAPVLILAVIIVAAICVVSFINTGVDLTDYIIIKDAEGFNGNGEIEYRLNEGALYDDLFAGKTSKKSKDVEKWDEDDWNSAVVAAGEDMEEYDNILKCITVSASKDTGLSNGDTVKVTATFKNSKNYKLHHHFKDGEKTYKVSGLQEGQGLDLFADGVFEIVYSGFTGSGTAEINKLINDGPYASVFYNLDKTFDLSNGDEITVTANFNASQLEEEGYFVTETNQKTYTITELHDYYNLSDGVDADVLSRLQNDAYNQTQTLIDGDMGSSSMYTLVEGNQIVDTFAFQVKDPSVLYEDWGKGIKVNNAVGVLTHYVLNYSGTGMDRTWNKWLLYFYPDFYMNDAGELVYNEANAKVYSMEADSREAFMEWADKQFEVMNMVKIG